MTNEQKSEDLGLGKIVITEDAHAALNLDDVAEALEEHACSVGSYRARHMHLLKFFPSILPSATTFHEDRNGHTFLVQSDTDRGVTELRLVEV